MERHYLNNSRGNAAYALREKFKELKGCWGPQQKLWWFRDEESMQAARKLLEAKEVALLTSPVDMKRSGGQDYGDIEQGYKYPPGMGW